MHPGDGAVADGHRRGAASLTAVKRRLCRASMITAASWCARTSWPEQRRGRCATRVDAAMARHGVQEAILIDNGKVSRPVASSPATLRVGARRVLRRPPGLRPDRRSRRRPGRGHRVRPLDQEVLVGSSSTAKATRAPAKSRSALRTGPGRASTPAARQSSVPDGKTQTAHHERRTEDGSWVPSMEVVLTKVG